MSISQDRLKALADAGDSVAKTHIRLANQVRNLIASYNRGEFTIEQILDAIDMACLGPEVSIVREIILINRELAHWQYTHVKNTQERNRLARKRAGLPAPPKKITNKLALKLSAEAAEEWKTPVGEPEITRKFGNTDDLQIDADSELELEVTPAGPEIDEALVEQLKNEGPKEPQTEEQRKIMEFLEKANGE